MTGNRIASANTANENIASLLNSSTLPSGLLSGGSILLNTSGTTTLLTSATSGSTTTTGSATFASNGILTIKAASQANLSGLNLGAKVTQVPGSVYTTGTTTTSGTSSTSTSYTYYPPVPPPPYYNSSINVPTP